MPKVEKERGRGEERREEKRSRAELNESELFNKSTKNNSTACYLFCAKKRSLK
jgi:hypothetical protein